MVLAASGLALLALLLVGGTLLFSSPAIFAGTPLAGRGDATVTSRQEATPGRGCDTVIYELVLDGGSVSYETCPTARRPTTSPATSSPSTPCRGRSASRPSSEVRRRTRVEDRRARRRRCAGHPHGADRGALPAAATPRAAGSLPDRASGRGSRPCRHRAPVPAGRRPPTARGEDEEEIVMLPAGAPKGLQVGMNLDIWPSRRIAAAAPAVRSVDRALPRRRPRLHPRLGPTEARAPLDFLTDRSGNVRAHGGPEPAARRPRPDRDGVGRRAAGAAARAAAVVGPARLRERAALPGLLRRGRRAPRRRHARSPTWHGCPFTTKADLRDNYPFGMFAVPREQVARVHASSGTTGKPTVVGYTRRDLDTWADVVARSIRAAGGRAGRHAAQRLRLRPVHRRARCARRRREARLHRGARLRRHDRAPGAAHHRLPARHHHGHARPTCSR